MAGRGVQGGASAPLGEHQAKTKKKPSQGSDADVQGDSCPLLHPLTLSCSLLLLLVVVEVVVVTEWTTATDSSQ